MKVSIFCRNDNRLEKKSLFMHTNVNGKYHLRDGQNIYFDIDVVYERKRWLTQSNWQFYSFSPNDYQ